MKLLSKIFIFLLIYQRDIFSMLRFQNLIKLVKLNFGLNNNYGARGYSTKKSLYSNLNLLKFYYDKSGPLAVGWNDDMNYSHETFCPHEFHLAPYFFEKNINPKKVNLIFLKNILSLSEHLSRFKVPVYVIFSKFCKLKDIVLLEKLLKMGINPNDQGLLYMAVDNNWIDGAKLLLDYGADINKENEFYDAPLKSAIANGNKTMCQFLILKGANWDLRNRHGEPRNLLKEKFGDFGDDINNFFIRD